MFLYGKILIENTFKNIFRAIKMQNMPKYLKINIIYLSETKY